MKGRADFGNGGEGRGIGAGEATEGEVHAMLLRLLWLAVFDKSRGDESSGYGRIAGTIGEVLARYGEVEAVAVVGFAVDLDWVGCVHMVFWFRKIGDWLCSTKRRWRWLRR